MSIFPSQKANLNHKINFQIQTFRFNVFARLFFFWKQMCGLVFDTLHSDYTEIQSLYSEEFGLLKSCLFLLMPCNITMGIITINIAWGKATSKNQQRSRIATSVISKKFEIFLPISPLNFIQCHMF